MICENIYKINVISIIELSHNDCLLLTICHLIRFEICCIYQCKVDCHMSALIVVVLIGIYGMASACPKKVVLFIAYLFVS